MLLMFLRLHTTDTGDILGWADLFQRFLIVKEGMRAIRGKYVLASLGAELNESQNKCLSGVFQSWGSDASWQ